MNVVGFAIYYNEVILQKINEIELFKHYDGIRGKATDSERSVKETMSRVFHEASGHETGTDEWTFFAEFIEPIAKQRTCYLFNKVDYDMMYSQIDLEEKNLIVYDPEYPGDTLIEPHVLWMFELAYKWDECGYENVVMLEKRKRENKTIQAPASRIYRPPR